jgi:acylphosphatase
VTAAAGQRAVLLRVHGRVQGVAYRASMQSEAIALGVSGWVRNRTDGTVEACIWGAQADVERLLEWARRGPPMARVERVACEPVEFPPESGRFEVRRSA